MKPLNFNRRSFPLLLRWTHSRSTSYSTPSLMILSLPFSPGVLPLKKKFISCIRSPTSWWNSTCAEAIESRHTLFRLYKASPSLDNWLAFKRSNIHCRKLLRREKRNGWTQLCSEFSYKTSTVTIWRFIRAFKNKSLSSNRKNWDLRSFTLQIMSSFLSIF